MGYSDAVGLYRDAGWPGVLPLPAGKKHPPPHGFTGGHAGDPTDEQYALWAESTNGNLALRLPENVIGLDVDDYPGKVGGETLRAAERRYGPLPPTWRSTARKPDGLSGIYFYRIRNVGHLPDRLTIEGKSDVEVVQRSHRYAVVHPSIHPNGDGYLWYRPEGGFVLDQVPSVDEIPYLPDAWLQGLLSQGGTLMGEGPRKAGASAEEVEEFLSGFDDGEACAEVTRYMDKHMALLEDPPGSRHDLAKDATMRLVSMGTEGHKGVRPALDAYADMFTSLVSADRDGARSEIERLIHGAAEVKLTERSAVSDGMVEVVSDPCEVISGEIVAQDTDYKELVDRKVRDMRATDDARRIVANERNQQTPMPEWNTAQDIIQNSVFVEPLIGLFVPGDELTAVNAAQKSGKTTFLLNMIQSMISGEPFLGEYSARKLAGRVAFVDFELSPSKQLEWFEEMKLPDKVRDRVMFTTLRGRAGSFDYMEDERRGQLARDLRALDTEVLILDPFGPYMRSRGVDENNSSEVGRLLDGLKSLQAEAGIKEIIVSLHTGHADLGRARGSSVLMDVPAQLINITVKRLNGEAKERYLSVEGREGDMAPRLLVWADEESKKLGLEKSLTKQEALELKEVTEENTLVGAVKEQPGLNASELTDATGYDRNRRGPIIRRCLDKGYIKEVAGGRNSKHFYPAGYVLDSE